MLKILVNVDNVDVDIIGPDIALHISNYRYGFHHCLPSVNGEYEASSNGRDFLMVPKDHLWEYPLVKINLFDDGECSGVSDQGLCMLVFELPAKDANLTVTLDDFPSFVTTWNNRTQIGFVLKKFVPNKPSEPSGEYLTAIINGVENRLGCRNTDELINPFCKHVTTHSYVNERLTLKEIATYLRVSREQFVKSKGKGGRGASLVRGNESKALIRATIDLLQKEASIINQTTVAKKCGLARKTVNKHWTEIAEGTV